MAPDPSSAETFRTTVRSTPAERAAWGSDRQPEGGPRLSLKVATPNAAGVAVRVVSARWEPAGSAVADVVLGTSGIHRSVPYREILVTPVREHDGNREVLVSLELEIDDGVARPGRGAALDPEAPGWDGLGHRRAFLNPWAAAPEPRGTIAAAAPASLPTGWRIAVSKDGLYRMDASYLASKGVDLSGVDPRNVHLRSRGVELPIVVAGESDGSFDPQDSIVFFGQARTGESAATWNGGDFTDTNAYWLSADGSAGLRMASVPGAPVNGYPTVTSLPHTLRSEKNNFLLVLYHLRPHGDVWYWGPIYGTNVGQFGASSSYTVNVPHPASGAATIQVTTAGLAVVDHSVDMLLNGQNPALRATPHTWNGRVLTDASFNFQGGLVAGDNTVTLVVPGYADHADFQLADRFEVTYDRQLVADANALDLPTPATAARYAASGFSSAPTILDLGATDPGTGLCMPTLVTGALFAAGTATFELPLGAGQRIALSSAALLPDGIFPAPQRDLLALHGADLLVIVHPALIPPGPSAWDTFLAARRSRMTVEVVDIQEIYDSFSDGILDPRAIRTFLTQAWSSWSRRPSSLLLVGDGTVDYKDYLDQKSVDPTYQNWVPTMLVEDLDDSAYFGRYATDAWFADVDADGYPDLATGRLAVRSPAALAAEASKILTYASTLGGPWASTIGYVADGYVEQWELESFELFADYIASIHTGPPWTTRKVFFSKPPYNSTDADLCASDIRQLFVESAMVRYGGHGAIRSWGKYGPIFSGSKIRNGNTQSDLDLLPFTPHPTFVIDATCFTNLFDSAVTPGLMEEALGLPGKGIIGAIGPTTIAYTFEEEAFTAELFERAFGMTKERTVGELVEAGRFELPASNVRAVMSLALLGDPTLKLRLPAPRIPENLKGASARGKAVLQWSYPTPGSFHAYRSTDGGTSFTRLTATPVTSKVYMDAAVSYGQTYHYTVTALDAGGFESGASNVVAVTVTSPTAPSTPAGVLVTDPGLQTALDVQWAANPEPDVDAYKVDYSRGGVGGSGSVIVPAPFTFARITGLVTGATYAITLQARNSSGLWSPRTAPVFGTPAPPSPLGELHVTRSGSDLVPVWSAGTGGPITLYRVVGRYDWVPQGVPYGADDRIVTLPGNTTSYVDAGAALLTGAVTYKVFESPP